MITLEWIKLVVIVVVVVVVYSVNLKFKYFYVDDSFIREMVRKILEKM